MPLEHDGVRALLAVRHPMVLVDRVLSLVPGQSVEALKAVSGCEPCYAGLPPDLPADRLAYPTSLLIESFAQAAAVMWLADRPAGGAGGDDRPGGDEDLVLVPAAMRDITVGDPVFPGDVVRHVVRMGRSLQGTAFLSGSSRVDGRTVLTVGEFIGVHRPRSLLAPA